VTKLCHEFGVLLFWNTVCESVAARAGQDVSGTYFTYFDKSHDISELTIWISHWHSVVANIASKQLYLVNLFTVVTGLHRLQLKPIIPGRLVITEPTASCRPRISTCRPTW